MKKNIKRLLFTVGATAAVAAAIPVGAASADNGDGNLACNRGEICFTYDGSYKYQKQFWNAASHDGYYFTNVSTGAGTSYPLLNDAYGIWNRDTSCQAKVINVQSFQPDDSQTFAANDGAWRVLNSSVQNKNDKHERVNCS